MATGVIQNENLLNSKQKNLFFKHTLHKLANDYQNVLLFNQIGRFCDHQYLWKETINVLDFCVDIFTVAKKVCI